MKDFYNISDVFVREYPNGIFSVSKTPEVIELAKKKQYLYKELEENIIIYPSDNLYESIIRFFSFDGICICALHLSEGYEYLNTDTDKEINGISIFWDKFSSVTLDALCNFISKIDEKRISKLEVLFQNGKHCFHIPENKENIMHIEIIIV